MTHQEIERIAKQINDEVHPVALYLFGSYAKGQASADSDIDLCIVYSRRESPIDLISIRLSLKALPYALDLVAFSEEEFAEQSHIWWSIPAQIKQEGVRLL